MKNRFLYISSIVIIMSVYATSAVYSGNTSNKPQIAPTINTVECVINNMTDAQINKYLSMSPEAKKAYKAVIETLIDGKSSDLKNIRALSILKPIPGIDASIQSDHPQGLRWYEYRRGMDDGTAWSLITSAEEREDMANHISDIAYLRISIEARESYCLGVNKATFNKFIWEPQLPHKLQR